MKIRWSIVFLALFGVVAALAAAVLTASLSAQRIQAAAPEAEREVTILVAAKDLPAMQTVKKDDVVEKVVKVSAAPKEYYSDPAQIVGKVLSLPVVEGQTYSDENFPSEGSGLLLATHLPKGKRAVQLALDDYAGLEGLLYPGCIVDVVASFRVDTSAKIGRAVSTTLLQNIQVLGVEGSTVVHKETEEEQQGRTRASRNMRKSLMVTVMVDSRQAEALQLAMEHGSVSLALRNPGDEVVSDSEATLLAEGKLAQLAELLSPKVSGGEREGTDEGVDEFSGEGELKLASKDGDSSLEPLVAGGQLATAPGSEKATEKSVKPAREKDRGPRYWEVDVIRGLNSQPKQFPSQN
jgi:pilus assembly protein CpaB